MGFEHVAQPGDAARGQLFSFDRLRARIVWRQFTVERFVNQYAMEAHPDGTLVFTSEAIENRTRLQQPESSQHLHRARYRRAWRAPLHRHGAPPRGLAERAD